MKLDLIVIGIVLLFAVGGMYLGAMRSLMKIISFFGSALVSLLLFPVLQKTALYQILVEKLKDILVNKGAVMFPEQAASLAAGILLALGLYFGSKLLLLLLSTVLEGVVRLPLLKQVNRLSGAVLGMAEAAVLIFGLLAVLRLIDATDLRVYSYLEESVLTKACYEYNPLMVFFAGK